MNAFDDTAVSPSSSPSTYSPSIRRAVTTPLCMVVSEPFPHKEKLRCLFCGGAQCKRCGPTAYESCKDEPGLEKVIDVIEV